MREPNKQEKLIRKFTNEFAEFMGWPKLPITRIKLCNLTSVRGLFMAADDGRTFVLISNNGEYYYNASEAELWIIVVHELAHAYLHFTGAGQKAFGHGKAFKTVCREIENKTNGYFSYDDLMLGVY
jgi:hypothetical protein